MKRVLLCAVAALLSFTSPSLATDLVIWHDKGDAGIKIFKEIGDLYHKVDPDVTVKSQSFPTDQWFARSTAGLQTGTGPDLLFNDNYRLAKLQQITGKLRSVKADFDAIPADLRSSLTATDVRAAQYNGQMLMIPIQRSLAGLGIRKS